MMKRAILTALTIFIMMALCACGTQSFSGTYGGPDFKELECTGEWELSYAKMFSVSEYGEYSLISTEDGYNYLVVPENTEIPHNLPADTTVLKKPLTNTYLVSSAVMDVLCTIDALDYVTMTGTKQEDWYIDKAINAMEEGSLLYAGKYNQPDYEMILSKDCRLAIENTMILHKPEVKEKLEELGIPVIIELSSYEEHPLGRLEWIKLYGLLFDRQEEANSFFDGQLKEMAKYEQQESNGQSVAFFYITSNGAVNIKKTGDYVPKMIRIAGGEYLPLEIPGEDENALSSMNMQLEEFYALAKDADILVYNSAITQDVHCIDDIIDKSNLFDDFKAVKEDRVYISGTNFFQETTAVCRMIEDFNIVLKQEDESGLHFLERIH